MTDKIFFIHIRLPTDVTIIESHTIIERFGLMVMTDFILKYENSNILFHRTETDKFHYL